KNINGQAVQSKHPPTGAEIKGTKQLTRNQLADFLEVVISENFDVLKTANIAYKCFMNPDLQDNPIISAILLALATMEEGPEFHMSQEKCLQLVAKLRDSSS